ncbi:MAG: hypothetical protein ABS89_00200 [Thiobacillus sp. SCN 63-1177]|nr:MAG: hypothetical protein ABS89_00200 [Thiobacillus sp. SCN 63-1177]
MNAYTHEIETDRENLLADLNTLLIEIDRVGPPDSTPGIFVLDTEYDRLVVRHWETRFNFECLGLYSLNRTFLDHLRTVLAIREIIDRLNGKKTTNRQKLRNVELSGMKVNPEQFDEYDIRLRRLHLEHEFRKALRKVVEGRDL